jgi:tRNA nucleotidyltransferase/poly(A) polymerase
MQQIQLSELETELCEILMKLVKDNQLQTQMRIAGGWVRDKLLNLESHDIDIALDNMTGEAFASLFSNCLGASSIGKIRANPEASKHLETACVRYKGIDIDFVNLRSEDYSQDSRIPTIVNNN